MASASGNASGSESTAREDDVAPSGDGGGEMFVLGEETENELEELDAAIAQREAELRVAEAREGALRARLETSRRDAGRLGEAVARLEANLSESRAGFGVPHRAPHTPHALGPQQQLEDLVGTWARARLSMGLGAVAEENPSS